MITVASPLDDLTLDVTQETRVHASLDDTFAALLEELGPHNKGMGEGIACAPTATTRSSRFATPPSVSFPTAIATTSRLAGRQ